MTNPTNLEGDIMKTLLERIDLTRHLYFAVQRDETDGYYKWLAVNVYILEEVRLVKINEELSKALSKPLEDDGTVPVLTYEYITEQLAYRLYERDMAPELTYEVL